MTFGSKWYFDPGLNAEGEEDEPPLTDPPTLPRARRTSRLLGVGQRGAADEMVRAAPAVILPNYISVPDEKDGCLVRSLTRSGWNCCSFP